MSLNKDPSSYARIDPAVVATWLPSEIRAFVGLALQDIATLAGEADKQRSVARAWQLVEELRAPEGASVTLVCDNPDFNGQPNNKIECCDDWTGWKPETFTGDTILEALETAHAKRAAVKAIASPPPVSPAEGKR